MQDIGRIKIFLQDSNKKDYFQIFREVLTLFWIKKEIPLYYFKYLYKKGVTNYKDHIGAKEAARIFKNKKINKFEYVSLLKNKLAFCLYMESCGIPTPQLIAHNYENHFILSGKLHLIDSEDDLLTFFDLLFTTHNLESIFVRPFSDEGGRNCLKIHRNNFREQLRGRFTKLTSSSFLYNRVIQQHRKINEIYSRSVNTLRFLSLMTKSNEVKILFASMRFGIGDSVVDNVASGGLHMGIDLAKGTLIGVAHQDIAFGNSEMVAHPDSGQHLPGFKIPFFKEAIELVKKASHFLPTTLVGWDIAITEKGPVLIEGNENPSLHGLDIACSGTLRNPYMRQLVDLAKY